MLSFREFVNAFRVLGIHPNQPVIVHASISSFGEIRGGADTVLGALLTVAKGVLAPTFTYKTMIIPEVGPENNACSYGSGGDSNRMAEFYQPDMPADPLMGVLPEILRKHPHSLRSTHPILSFAGVNVEEALRSQTLDEPLAPIRVLAEQDGMVLLMGVNHTVNTSIHHAERLAGRKQFVRWALTPAGVRECPHFPGCSDGFEQAASFLSGIGCVTRFGGTTLEAIPLAPMIHALSELIKQQPQALLCGKNDERCEAVRNSVRSSVRANNKRGQNSE
jgi:aminoglycoside 3-N-acetyltransferase